MTDAKVRIEEDMFILNCIAEELGVDTSHPCTREDLRENLRQHVLRLFRTVFNGYEPVGFDEVCEEHINYLFPEWVKEESATTKMIRDLKSMGFDDVQLGKKYCQVAESLNDAVSRKGFYTPGINNAIADLVRYGKQAMRAQVFKPFSSPIILGAPAVIADIRNQTSNVMPHLVKFLDSLKGFNKEDLCDMFAATLFANLFKVNGAPANQTFQGGTLIGLAHTYGGDDLILQVLEILNNKVENIIYPLDRMEERGVFLDFKHTAVVAIVKHIMGLA